MGGYLGSFDISGLLKAGMLVLGIATAVRHFEDVQRWAIMEFAKSITTVKLTYFRFPSEHAHKQRFLFPGSRRISSLIQIVQGLQTNTGS